MAYQPQIYYPNNFQPQYQNNYQPQIPMQNVYSNNNSGINWVSGESGAKSWIVAKGETTILLDSEDNVFYIKTADASGMPLLRKFSYVEITGDSKMPQTVDKQFSFVERDEFEQFKEDILKKLSTGNKQTKTSKVEQE